MSNETSIDSVFSKLQQEKATGELTALQKDFYLHAEALMQNLSPTSEDSKRQAENLRRMLSSLRERRKQKMLMYLAYSKPLPQPLPEEEEVLYNEIRQILNKDSSKAQFAKLKVLADIPEVLTTEGRKLGPFKQGQIIEVSNRSDVEFIIKNKIAESIV